jgi:hypothetical protein
MPNFVQDYRSTDLNSPPCTGESGSATNLLDCVLATGYGFTGMSISSLTRAGTVATATVGTADGVKLQTGMILTMAGATGADATLYNISASITKASATTFTYSMIGTPTGTATGTIICDALLRITGITRSGSIATATLLNANATLRTGNRLTVSGADQVEYNGVQQITVIDGTHFSYTISGTPTTPATTSTAFAYRKAPLAWTTVFTAANKRVYRSPDAASNQFYLRVDDSTVVGNVREAYARGFETMSDIDTGTGTFPTVAQMANGMSWNKSFTADSTARAWTLVGDDKTFYFWPKLDAVATILLAFGFGHVISNKPGDAFNTFLTGTPLTAYLGVSGVTQGWTPLTYYTPPTTWGSGSVGTAMLYLARQYAQTGGAVAVSAFDGRSVNGAHIGGSGNAGILYPNGPDGGLWVTSLLVQEHTGGVQLIRGRFPGLYVHLHSTIPQNHYDLVTGVVGLSGVTLLAIQFANNVSSNAQAPGMHHIDITGPWA